MEKKTQPIYMLSKKDSPQNKRFTQAKSKGWKKYSMQIETKKSWGSNTYV